jgi:phage shock protein PspC (stress-responsive transcriptional regulator)
MKKNISINISGIIFYIEEDGYDKLKDYLDGINQYFSKFEDNSEIVSDIESRIAEIFLAKLKDGKQVITREDVVSLIATMGSISDFKAVQEPEEENTEQTNEEHAYSSSTEGRKLFRDTKRNIIGGVAAGLGNYFSIDPLWIRLIFLLLFISLFFEFEISLIIPIIYIVMWIVIPGSDELKEGKKYKKMFRNPDGKVLGGVASGIASYFGIDVVVVRLLFVLLIFAAFSGPIIYILLWIIIPEAKSITEKMEMQGEPVTLSNIEQNIKRSLNVEEGEENTLVKILLFPFRLLALIIEGLGKILSPLLKFLVEAVRVLAGVLIIITGVGLMFSLLVILGAAIGLHTGNVFVNIDILPLELIQNTLPATPLIATVIALFIPALFLSLLGVMIISLNNLIKPALGWSLFAVWVIAILSLAISLPQVAADFKVEAEVKEEKTYLIDGTTVITMQEKVLDYEYEDIRLRIRPHDKPFHMLQINKEARGRTIEDAKENAQMLLYDVIVNDSIIAFPYNPVFAENAVFRAQELDMILYVPYERPFILEVKLANILRNTLHIHGYSASDMRDNVWKYTKEDGLVCTTCSVPTKTAEENSTKEPNFVPVDTNVRDFTYLDIGNTFIVNVIKGDDYKIEFNENNQMSDDVVFEKDSETLKIRYRNSDNFFDANRNKLKLNITMPQIAGVNLQGASQTYIQNFNLEQFRANLSGTAKAQINMTVEDANVDLSGASKLILSGVARNLNAELDGIASLEAYDMVISEATIDANAAANVKIYVTDFLRVNASGGTTIKYKGNPKIDATESVASSIERVE